MADRDMGRGKDPVESMDAGECYHCSGRRSDRAFAANSWNRLAWTDGSDNPPAGIPYGVWGKRKKADFFLVSGTKTGIYLVGRIAIPDRGTEKNLAKCCSDSSDNRRRKPVSGASRQTEEGKAGDNSIYSGDQQKRETMHLHGLAGYRKPAVLPESATCDTDHIPDSGTVGGERSFWRNGLSGYSVSVGWMRRRDIAWICM